MRPTNRPLLLGVALVGVLGTVLVAALGDIPSGRSTGLVIRSVVGAAATGGGAVLVLSRLRDRSIALQAAVAALAPVLTVAVGVSLAVSGMIVMGEYLWVLGTVLVGAGTVGVLAALVLGERVASASRSVGAMARQLGEGTGAPVVAPATAPGELADVAVELVRTSQRLREAEESAAAGERSRRELVAWVSHDLRTPLAGIRAMVEALEDGVVEDEPTTQRYHRTIRREVDHLTALVNDLFELSRITAGTLDLTFEPLGLDELVEDAIAAVAARAAATGVTLHAELDDPPPVIRLSGAEMARVLRNLLDNAIRHTPSGGTVTVVAGVDRDPDGDPEAHAHAGTVTVSVQDGCGGIPPDDLDRVFELAFRGDAARTPTRAGDPPGGGVGLAVARGLVEAHGGMITVRNADAGCRFTVHLPPSPELET